ncbi:MAG TPA: hypothetical protein DCY98_09360 [Nitrospinae bacterium]|nr:hypothetical protein [Nitrospinota bacterium]
MNKKIIFLLVIISVLIGSDSFSSQKETIKAEKVYWFIPDGVRAEPDIFTIYKWAEEGKLPNIKRMMENGAYGYSIPDFPGHTPVNFASLLTGTHPTVHGIADGPMHVEGFPLLKPSAPGFASTSKKVAPIWKALEDAGKKVALLAIPGSTPPELVNGITIRGRWAPWGADTPAINFEPTEKIIERKEAGRAFKLFYLGQKLTEFVDKSVASGWENTPQSFSQAKEAKLESYGLPIHVYIFDSSDDKSVNYDSIRFSLDKKSELLTLKQGLWSEWKNVSLKWKEQSFDSQVRIKIIKLWPENGNFRIRLFFNNMNKFIVEPPEVAQEITQNIGPMVDFVDNWPAQLIYENEDKNTFFEEAMDSLEWHRKAAGFILKKYQTDAFIQDTYTPNQMLESRWWHRYIDRKHPDYAGPKKEKEAWDDILKMYQGVDAILGEAMKNADEKTLFVFSSDHGIMPLYKQVRINNLFAQKGWLKFTIDEKTGEPLIDWKNTKAIYLKMAHVYVNSDGLDGDWRRASGKEYDNLRDEVIKAISELQDDNGVKPLVHAAKWEDAPKYFELPADRVGDIVLEVEPGYQWQEEVTKDLQLFTKSLNSGYKQAINPDNNKGMWTPFVIMGTGIKKDFQMKEPISHIDQMPTILHLLGVKIPDYVQGRVLTEVLR